MLSITNIKPKQGAKYYREENYYSKEEAKEKSQWSGRGAAALGLNGHVEKEAFENLLNGYSPDRKQVLSGRAIKTQRRAGVDLTFSAPKSVSIAALVGGDSLLEEAHRAAIERTLAVIEQRYTQARIGTAGKRQVVNTGNLVVAQFHHDSSREKDPQLHTHCVVLNATQLENGQWRAQHNDLLYSNKMLLGQIYRNELALECRRLGYEIEQKENGLFEIKGYTPEQLEAFSKRSEQIESLVGKDASSKEKEVAALHTRAAKGKEIMREQLKQYWQWQAESLNIQHPHPQTQTQLSHQDTAQLAVENGIEHCSERDVSFKREEVEKFVLAEVGRHSWHDLQSAFNRNPSLLKAIDGKYTTRSGLQRELDTIRLVQQSQVTCPSIATPEQVESYLENKSLTQGQRQAIALATTTNDRFIAWQGVAGAGKTYALNEFRQIAAARGYTLKAFAPSSEAARVVGDEVGIESNTVASLLVSKQPPEVQPEQIWIVDEAGLLSAKDAYALLRRATSAQARVILVGDTRQLSAVEAGNPFKSLQLSGIQTAFLNQSIRQKVTELQEAVDLVANGKIREGIERLEKSDLKQDGRIKIVPAPRDRAARITADYMALSPEQRDKTLILAGTNAERLAITQEIRTALKLEGSLGQEATVTQLKAKDLTSVQMRFTHNYLIGDVVMPLRNYKRLGLAKGELYTIVKIEDARLTLQSSDGTTKTVSPNEFRQAVYERQQLEIAKGDRLRWTRNDHTLGRRNGQEFTVTAIEGSTAKIEYKGGKTEQIDLQSSQHLDHALVSTTYSSQGKTAERVLVSISADRTLGKESFYVAASRAKYDLQIYAEDRLALLERALVSHAKQNPLEAILERHEQAKNSLRQSLVKLRSERLDEVSLRPSLSVMATQNQEKTQQKPQNWRIKR